jgi:hypothetical protein
MGMNKEAVQNERQPRNTATVRTQIVGDEEEVTEKSITVTAMQQFNGG